MSQCLAKLAKKGLSNDSRRDLNEIVREGAIWRPSVPGKGDKKGTGRNKEHTCFTLVV